MKLKQRIITTTRSLWVAASEDGSDLQINAQYLLFGLEFTIIVTKGNSQQPKVTVPSLWVIGSAQNTQASHLFACKSPIVGDPNVWVEVDDDDEIFQLRNSILNQPETPLFTIGPTGFKGEVGEAGDPGPRGTQGPTGDIGKLLPPQNFPNINALIAWVLNEPNLQIPNSIRNHPTFLQIVADYSGVVLE